MSFKATAGDLTSHHLGRSIQIRTGQGHSASGMLVRIEHVANIVTDQAFGDAEPSYYVGRREVSLELHPWGSATLAHNATVEILD